MRKGSEGDCNLDAIFSFPANMLMDVRIFHRVVVSYARVVSCDVANCLVVLRVCCIK